jgi:hypothetical protein
MVCLTHPYLISIEILDKDSNVIHRPKTQHNLEAGIFLKTINLYSAPRMSFRHSC